MSAMKPLFVLRFFLLSRPLFWSAVLGTFAVGALVSLSAVALWYGRQNAEKAADQAALNVVQSIEIEVARNFELFDLSLQGAIIASQEPTLAALTGKARHLALFDNAVKAKYLNAIILLDETGAIVADSLSLEPRQGNFADRDYFRAHQDTSGLGMYLSKPFQSRLSQDQWVVAISRRIDKPDGAFGGVAVGVIQLEYFQSVVKHLSLGPNGSVALVRSDGSLIARRPVAYKTGAAFSGSHLFAHYPTTKSGRFEAPGNSDGVWRRFIFEEIPGLPIVVAMGLALDDIYGSWRFEAAQILGLTLVMITAMAALALLMSREFMRRVRSDGRLRESEARYRLLADNSSDAIILRNSQAVRTYASPAFFKMVGRSADDLGERSILEDLDEEGRKNTRRAFERIRLGESHVVTGFEYCRPDGQMMWLEAISNGIYDARGVLTEVVTNLRDVTARKRAEDDLAVAAATDALTGLGNRRAFEERMTLEWKRAIRSKSEMCVLMIDVDFFKAYNDSFGHLEGDTALRRIGEAIAGSLRRPGDFGARYGGEEFIAILPETDPCGGLVVAENLRQAVTKIAIALLATGTLTVSVGLATTRPVAGEVWLDLVSRSDAALYRAKRLGRNRSILATDQDSDRLSA